MASSLAKSSSYVTGLTSTATTLRNSALTSSVLPRCRPLMARPTRRPWAATTALSPLNCKNKATALKFVKWWTSKESEQYNLEKQSNAPIYGELYTKDENVKKLPYLPTLKASLDAAKGRPHAVAYGDVTAAIQDAIYPALQGKTDAESAAKQLAEKLKTIIKN